MAGDWIKMRSNLWDDPRVARLCDITDSGEAAIIGALYWLWSAADQHSEDGIMPGLTLRSIDRKTGVPGFGDALVLVDWLADHPDGVRIVRFEEHNGASAKRRCAESKRKMSARDADKMRTTSGQDGDAEQQSCAPRERVREESKPLKAKSRAEAATASRLPADWTPSDVDQRFCATERPDLDCKAVADRFRDHWISKAGADGRKRDWSATWRNWVRRENTIQARASPRQGLHESRADTIAILTGRGKNERTSNTERDITGESVRIA